VPKTAFVQLSLGPYFGCVNLDQLNENTNHSTFTLIIWYIKRGIKTASEKGRNKSELHSVSGNPGKLLSLTADTNRLLSGADLDLLRWAEVKRLRW